MRCFAYLALFGLFLSGCSNEPISDESTASSETLEESTDTSEESTIGETQEEELSESARMALNDLANGESFAFGFALQDVNGQEQSLASHQGKVVIVDIWGTWCPPCRAEIPSFVKLQEEYGDQGFQMLGVNYEGGSPDEDTEKVKAFIAENGINYPCMLGDEATQEQVPNFRGYPTTVFIDKTGKVRMQAVGLHDYEYLSAVVSQLLSET